ncbi:hypothetical protein GYMLUDRAFT_48477 [Collybiopsis luxurians FD-317 M1]|uniref:Mitochondrial chaperone BCS1 n=1 Tax=Collybiopsis luxurians FD-317 M1 TaxID=944289 RepID=A0A0D0CIE9_9AGAR|nr:hypothetical protein GYMLUDRAFT_48477 [Collybiopsis luxurians FD-317 M1]
MTSFVQKVFTSLLAPNASSDALFNSASSSTPAASGAAQSADFSSIITLLFSFSALRDWSKLILIGGSFETCRRLVFGLYYKILASFWVNAYFEETDACYRWMMVWLSNQPSWKKARDVEISTSTYGAKNISMALDPQDSIGHQNKSYRTLSFLPSLSVTYHLWYKNCYMSITRTKEESGMGMFGRHKEHTLRISLLTRDREMLTRLLQDARENYMDAQESSMNVFAADGMSNRWKHVASRAKRSMSSIILDPGIKESLLRDARDFLDSKTWYTERGIPFRRGYLLWGVPGSGKSSLIHAIAGELGLDVFEISLSKLGLDDSSLNELINNLPERAIALMEDIDVAYTHALTRDSGSAADVTPNPMSMTVRNPVMPGGFPGAAQPGGSRITLSGLLNALDGVSAQEGRILFATTNKYSSLDAALCRPGRMDVHIEFKLASKYQAKELFLRFFNPGIDNTSTLISQADHDNDSVSDDSVINSGVDSGYSSSTHTLDGEDSGQQLLLTGGGAAVHTLKLLPKRLEALATKFSEEIPDREFSMAALQGYLMMYKMQPEEAVEQVGEWLEKERMEQDAKIESAQNDQGKPGIEMKKDELELVKKMERDIMQRVEKEVREKMMRERLEKDITERVEREMATKMDIWFNEGKQKPLETMS